MADLVLALATSHSPMLGGTEDDYLLHAERDKANPNILDKNGDPCRYEDLLAAADPAMAHELTPDVVARRVKTCQDGIARLAGTLAAAELDALIIVGDDQGEQFLEDNMPAMLIYWGETIDNDVLPLPKDAPDFWRRARSQFHEPDARRTYPVASRLGLHLIESLVDDGFDISHSRALPRSGGEGHAFGFIHRRLMGGMGEKIVPIVPVALNTYFPPNQPTPARCHDLGRALARAVAQWGTPGRVGIAASGGLSHYTVDEDLDRGLMTAIRDRDADAIRAIPRNKLNSGNSEIRNWITVAGAAEGLRPVWQDYAPCYRSPAGTGCGMGFAEWS